MARPSPASSAQTSCVCVCPGCAIWIMLCIAGVASQTTHSWNSNNKGSTEGYTKLKGFRMSHDSCACQANWQSNTVKECAEWNGEPKTERRESWKLVWSLFQLSYDWRINLGQFGMLIERAEIDIYISLYEKRERKASMELAEGLLKESSVRLSKWRSKCLFFRYERWYIKRL